MRGPSTKSASPSGKIERPSDLEAATALVDSFPPKGWKDCHRCRERRIETVHSILLWTRETLHLLASAPPLPDVKARVTEAASLAKELRRTLLGIESEGEGADEESDAALDCYHPALEAYHSAAILAETLAGDAWARPRSEVAKPANKEALKAYALALSGGGDNLVKVIESLPAVLQALEHLEELALQHAAIVSRSKSSEPPPGRTIPVKRASSAEIIARAAARAFVIALEHLPSIGSWALWFVERFAEQIGHEPPDRNAVRKAMAAIEADAKQFIAVTHPGAVRPHEARRASEGRGAGARRQQRPA